MYNTDMERKLRKNQDILFITGCGVLVLSLWSLLKTILFITLDYEHFRLLFVGYAGTDDLMGIAIAFVLFILVLDGLLRFFVFRRARIESRGHRANKKAGWLYIVIACWFSLLSAYSIYYYFTPDAVIDSVTDTAVSIIFELTSLATSLELIISAIRVKLLRRALGDSLSAENASTIFTKES